MNRLFAIIKDNKVINIIIEPSEEELKANSNNYIEYTNGWDYDNGIDGGDFFPKPILNNDESSTEL